ncbi:MAG: helix-turn-helix domain-containing protein [Kiritimatiellae bacterium]|nr:helix-turn-helix domain-containing protein [Kiritimatiellia bacterium]
MDGLSVLRALAERPGPVTCTGLSQALGLELTRTNRLLKTLAHLGLAHRTNGRKYAAGPGLHVLAAQSLFGSGLLKHALPHVDALHETGLLAALGVLWEDHVSYLYHRGHYTSLAESIGREPPYPATLSSIGMVLLAELPDAEIKRLYAGKEIPGYADMPTLLRAIAQVRGQGFALVEVKRPSLAVKLGSPAYAGVALSGRMTPGELPGHVATLRQVADQIEAELKERHGY